MYPGLWGGALIGAIARLFANGFDFVLLKVLVTCLGAGGRVTAGCRNGLNGGALNGFVIGGGMLSAGGGVVELGASDGIGGGGICTNGGATFGPGVGKFGI